MICIERMATIRINVMKKKKKQKKKNKKKKKLQKIKTFRFFMSGNCDNTARPQEQ
jgi:hypothetical protein